MPYLPKHVAGVVEFVPFHAKQQTVPALATTTNHGETPLPLQTGEDDKVRTVICHFAQFATKQWAGKLGGIHFLAEVSGYDD